MQISVVSSCEAIPYQPDSFFKIKTAVPWVEFFEKIIRKFTNTLE